MEPSTGMTDQTVSVLCHHPVPEPALSLYLIHHAGGSHIAFRPWLRFFPEDWEIRLVVAPGRPKAARHPAVRDLTVVSDALAAHLAERDDGPYALFGHSMGALVAFAAALELQDRGARQPEWLGISGHPGPFNAITRSKPPLHGLPPDELRAALIALDGLPPRILRDRSLWERVQPMVRADLEAAETWRPRRRPAVVDRPLSAFCGESDQVADAADVIRWGEHTTRFHGVRAFPGGHFYFRHDPGAVVARIVADVRAVLSANAAGAGTP
jgi:surfactin synthase thioesterase subunit